MKTVLYLSLFSVSVAFGAVEVENATFGFSDSYKTGTWAPLTITVRSQDEPDGFTGELVVEVQNFTSNTPFERYATPLRLSPTGRQREHFAVYCPKNATRLVIKLVSTTLVGNNRLHNVGGVYNADSSHEVLLPTPIARKDYLVLVLAPSGDKLKRFIDKKQLKGSGNAQVHVKYLPNSKSLLHDWIGYSAVDVLVIRETFLTERRISKPQQTALLDWVQRGGTLILSGGSSFSALRGSFIEPLLPVELKGLKKTDTLPNALGEQLGFQLSDSNGVLFERIAFAPKVGGETLIGTDEQIYVAKRNFGDGQILCLAFDYNAPPFSEQKRGEAFWQHLLSESGKSPRHLEDQYALSRQHEERIYKQFLSKMPTQVPLIKLLAIVLPAYLLLFGGFLLYFARSERKSSGYWVGSCLFILLSMGTIAVGKNILPNNMAADRLSILSVYPGRQRAHLQSFVSIRAPARTETSLQFPNGTFIRHLNVENPRAASHQKIGTLVQNSRVQLRGLFLDPWTPTTYVKETFLDVQQLPPILEDEELNDTRKAFARILRQEAVLQYLTLEMDVNRPSYIIGWISHSFTDMRVDENFNANDETLVIFRPSAKQ